MSWPPRKKKCAGREWFIKHCPKLATCLQGKSRHHQKPCKCGLKREMVLGDGFIYSERSQKRGGLSSGLSFIRGTGVVLMQAFWVGPCLLTLPDSVTSQKQNHQSSMHSLLLAIFLNPSFSSAGVWNSFCKFCGQQGFNCWGNRSQEISWFSHISWWSTVAVGKQEHELYAVA